MFGEIKTDPDLLALLEAAKHHVMTPEEIREQRISFVYGQMMDCAPGMSKDDVRKISDAVYGK